MRQLLPSGVRLRGLALLVGLATGAGSLWQSATDPATGRVYYYNTATGATQWAAPPDLAESQMYGSIPSPQVDASYLSQKPSLHSEATAPTWTQSGTSEGNHPAGHQYSATRRGEPLGFDTSAQYAQPAPVAQDYLLDLENSTAFPKRLVEESACEEYGNSMPKGSKKSKNSIDAAFKCRDGGFLTLRQGVRSREGDWSMVVAKRGERKASEVCVEIVPRAINSSDLSSNVRLRGGKAETLFTLRFRMRLDGAPGGFMQINYPPAKPTWVVTATAEGGEDHLFRITCSHDDEGQWVHLQHVKSRAYINCIGNRNVRGHGTPPQQFHGARREVSTGLELIPCPDMQLNSKDAGYLTA